MSKNLIDNFISLLRMSHRQLELCLQFLLNNRSQRKYEINRKQSKLIIYLSIFSCHFSTHRISRKCSPSSNVIEQSLLWQFIAHKDVSGCTEVDILNCPLVVSHIFYYT